MVTNLKQRSVRLSRSDPGTYLILIAAAVLLVSLIEIIEPFELPFESTVAAAFASGSASSVQIVTSSMSSYGYLGLFVLMLLESASLPVPSEVILPFAGYMVYSGTMSFWLAVFVGTAAGVGGALADYFLALKVGRPVVQRIFRWTGLRADHLDRAERWLDSRGAWSILVSRFIPGLRSAISLPAGALKMKLSTFIVMTTIGAFGWSALLVYLGYSAGSLWATALSASAPVLSEVVLLCAAGASALYIAYRLAAIARSGSDLSGAGQV